MTCKDCIHYDVCPLGLAIQGKTGTCLKFKNKADFVEVVRCKDCKHLMFSDMYGECNKRFEIVRPDDFCSYGERKEE